MAHVQVEIELIVERAERGDVRLDGQVTVERRLAERMIADARQARLTRIGHSLLKPVEEISVWAENNASFVQKKRQEFEARVVKPPRARAAA